MALLDTGDRVSDTLVVDRLLGEGAFAEVHRVRHRFLGWQAMKLFKRVASAWETRAMLGEARLLSTLGHPNIIRCFDAGTVPTADGIRGWFTMEYVPGGSLERLAAAHHPAVPTGLAVQAVTQMAAGLALAHDQEPPILHRDLTPANILVGYDGDGLRIRLSDFGLARAADPVSRLASAQGTYAFMAPEVVRGRGYSPAADVWSVGAIAYLLLTNNLPYDDGSPLSSPVLTRFRQPLLPPSAYNDAVDPALDRIVLDTLRVPVAERTASARVLSDALTAYRRDGGRRQPPADKPGPPQRPPSEVALRLAEEAFALSRVPGQLDRAADLLEEAVTLAPRLRELHLAVLIMWRRGVLG